MKIGNIEIKNKTVLAPMAGVNCTSFRLMCKKHGAGLVFTQMYNVQTIIDKQEEGSLKDFLNILDEERPIAIQLIGNKDDNWEKAIKSINPYADIIDLHFGCPEKEQVERGAGSYLMQHPKQISKIVQTCKSSTKKPITAKIRSGYEEVNALEIAKLLEKENISAITIHPRTKEQYYRGKSDWKIIKQLKDNLSIPIIGNGDISISGHAKAMIEQTNCDAVMVGREAMKNPEIFNQINYLLKNGKNFEDRNKDQNILIKEFIALYKQHEKRQSMNELHDHCSWLISNHQNAEHIRKKIRNTKTIEELKELFN